MIDYKKKYLKYKKKYLAIKKLMRGGGGGHRRGKKKKSWYTPAQNNSGYNNDTWQCNKCNSQYNVYGEAVQCEQWCTENAGEEWEDPFNVYVPQNQGYGNRVWYSQQQWNEWEQQKRRAEERERQQQLQQQQWQQQQQQQQWQQQQQQQQWQPPAMTQGYAWDLLNSAPINDQRFLEAGQWLVREGYADQGLVEQYMVNRGYRF